MKVMFQESCVNSKVLRKGFISTNANGHLDLIQLLEGRHAAFCFRSNSESGSHQFAVVMLMLIMQQSPSVTYIFLATCSTAKDILSQGRQRGRTGC